MDLWAASHGHLDVCDVGAPEWARPPAASRSALHRLRRHLAPWLLPLLLLAAWEMASRSGALATRILPEPLSVARAAWRLWLDGSLMTDVAASTGRALSGFAVGATLGLLLGLATGLSRWLEALLDSTLQMIRNIPALATIPLVILWFGIDESAKRFLVALGVFFPVYVNTYHGIRSVDRDLIEMARSYDLRGWPLCRDVVIPGALPSILVGVRFALGLMWVMLIVAETISAQSGIGFMTMNARVFMQTDVVLVGILLYALLGKLADLLAKALEFALLPWQRARASARSS
ncbi:ABC transporter permease subunit [Chitinasiproducens palmae]|uniref:ABC transporter permease subunit n=1 Tax=Chitinasiproducens palmae TaxID=1770053 RepID=UPI0038B3EBBC